MITVLALTVFQPDESSYKPKNIMITGGAGFM
jgi:hypothetical protein